MADGAKRPARRARAGPSQADLGEPSTSPDGHAIERERYALPSELAFALAKHFGCATADIFDPDSDPP
ncbi:hypothetical protein J2752_001155 [Halarchaeum rubridurum]|uniref:Uncharacterized protein n=1 Tax=Halarchaeum rubridurum TaxID=489911 RepID=A0A830FY91_9EURY|nr:transcriptional regulator [Halarchaeum rubridurum]MBP1954274.1 hypothetical protein [Halarchaeum rubridurum]GGM58755.1 hypothetical protein GCM10009017_06080 [Halarchaeum rubridurum]